LTRAALGFNAEAAGLLKDKGIALGHTRAPASPRGSSSNSHHGTRSAGAIPHRPGQREGLGEKMIGMLDGYRANFATFGNWNFRPATYSLSKFSIHPLEARKLWDEINNCPFSRTTS
jgi:hypothetical protein